MEITKAAGVAGAHMAGGAARITPDDLSARCGLILRWASVMAGGLGSGQLLMLVVDTGKRRRFSVASLVKVL
ncbi:hypothetical protein VFPFJ_07138 [Purpureocillium lilacinum]|uniref:Uncharacterized protein n=1 Tax=Purpureocillium lilacinum TaxID=33203 RepID=A0A179GPU3_PURLI|nr:hypothetical protein VFPFJ_07138 [Purpureocillium lilacinum]OAQ79925.1 hypothetical protein VFPBJ_05510 [Purpureocillium lilacinum]OAQ88673.1 hypothetical protein VFPFJ_07138 [Purpureocillium lilacinum]